MLSRLSETSQSLRPRVSLSPKGVTVRWEEGVDSGEGDAPGRWKRNWEGLGPVEVGVLGVRSARVGVLCREVRFKLLRRSAAR